MNSNRTRAPAKQGVELCQLSIAPGEMRVARRQINEPLSRALLQVPGTGCRLVSRNVNVIGVLNRDGERRCLIGDRRGNRLARDG